MKRGFTLIELLAVIVILAIIAVIATPIVLSIIKNSKVSANIRSAENYLDAVENAIAKEKINNVAFNPSNCKIGKENGQSIINCDGTKLNIELSGKIPDDSVINFFNGSVVDGSYFKIDDAVVNYYADSAIISNKYSVYNTDGTPIYYNPVTNSKLNTETSCNNDIDCKVFYVLEDKGKDYAFLSLIMDSNINSDGVAVKNNLIENKGFTPWISEQDYNFGVSSFVIGNVGTDKGPVSAIKYLNIATSRWNVFTSIASKEQIENINSSTVPKWLCNYLNYPDNTVPDLWGYWTLTPRDGYGDLAWTIGSNIDFEGIRSYSHYGVRPVIIISKSKLE